jgi:hypothetical protein
MLTQLDLNLARMQKCQPLSHICILLRSCIGPIISSLQLKHFGKNGNKNGTNDYPACDVDAVGRLVAVLVVTVGEDIEAFPVGPSREY